MRSTHHGHPVHKLCVDEEKAQAVVDEIKGLPAAMR
jgi:hypothetical protein